MSATLVFDEKRRLEEELAIEISNIVRKRYAADYPEYDFLCVPPHRDETEFTFSIEFPVRKRVRAHFSSLNPAELWEFKRTNGLEDMILSRMKPAVDDVRKEIERLRGNIR